MKYPTQASQVDALYMNLCLTDLETVNDDDDIEIVEVTVLPPQYATDSPDAACIKEIYLAMNTCADLHPGPDDSDEGEEEDETAPGATGWITAENMDDYLDEEGNFRGRVFGDAEGEEDLGPGAGTVRQREETGEEHTNGVNGTEADSKWQRTG
jgi:chloride channel, nucleotide-sensitive, 1A